MLKQLLSVALFIFASSTSALSQSQRFNGAELTYDWVSDSTYIFTLTLHSPCDSIYMLPANATICYFNSCNNVNGTLTLALQPAPVPAINRYAYSGNITMPFKCDYWTFHATVEMLPSINLAGTGPIYVAAMLNNLDAPSSSSPKFTVDPITSICNNQPTILLTGPLDADMDSIVAELVPHRTSSGGIFAICDASSSPVAYIPPYSATNPNMVVNPATGVVSFAANTNDTGYLNYAVRVNKYRRSDGKKLGSVMRDAQAKLRSCNISPAVASGVVPGGISGATYNGATVNAYANTPFAICVYGALPQGTNHQLTMSDNAATALPGSMVSYIATTPDSIVGCLMFSPTLADTGDYTVIFAVKDSMLDVNNCNYPVVLQSFEILFIRIHAPMGIPDQNLGQHIVIYPNPASTSISISASSPLLTSVLSMDGKTLITPTMDKSIDISGLSSGVYLIQIRDEAGTLVKSEKLIKADW